MHGIVSWKFSKISNEEFLGHFGKQHCIDEPRNTSGVRAWLPCQGTLSLVCVENVSKFNICQKEKSTYVVSGSCERTDTCGHEDMKFYSR